MFGQPFMTMLVVLKQLFYTKLVLEQLFFFSCVGTVMFEWQFWLRLEQYSILAVFEQLFVESCLYDDVGCI